MSFQIVRGLFKLDNFTDHHAILGVPVDADEKVIRKRYLVISRQLHPDSSNAESEADKKLASELFSKLVNPAYTKLSKDRDRAEYLVLLGLMGKRGSQEGQKVEIESDRAKKLSQDSQYENTYKTLVNDLAQKQYESLAQSLDIIAEISELNMVYLMRQESKGAVAGKPQETKQPATATATPAPTRTAPPATAAAPAPPPAATVSRVDPFYMRAEKWLAQNDLDQARQELDAALKIEPKNSRCHGLLGMVYLKKKQPGMAKVHINNALQLNPQEPVALEAKKILEKPPKKPGKPEGGGGLFGLFGGGGGKKK